MGTGCRVAKVEWSTAKNSMFSRATPFTAIFLFAPGSEVIGTTLLQAWTQGEVGLVSALATLQVLVIGICVTAARAIFGVKLYG
jgi:ABC-type Fe3+ transport system permease subunit